MLTRDDVLKIAKLARLELSENEIELYQKRLSRVLDYVKELEGVEAESADFVQHVPMDATYLRDDLVSPFNDFDALLENAPQREGNYFVIPAVVEKS